MAYFNQSLIPVGPIQPMIISENDIQKFKHIEKIWGIRHFSVDSVEKDLKVASFILGYEDPYFRPKIQQLVKENKIVPIKLEDEKDIYYYRPQDIQLIMQIAKMALPPSLSDKEFPLSLIDLNDSLISFGQHLEKTKEARLKANDKTREIVYPELQKYVQILTAHIPKTVKEAEMLGYGNKANLDKISKTLENMNKAIEAEMGQWKGIGNPRVEALIAWLSVELTKMQMKIIEVSKAVAGIPPDEKDE